MDQRIKMNRHYVNSGSHHLSTAVTFLWLSLSAVLTAPTVSLIQSSSSSLSSSASPFCKTNTNINQVYNIGRDIYLTLNSRSIYRFDVDQRQIYEHKYDINQLFGKNKFKWVDTVISLKGICNIAGLCPDEQSNDLERIHLAIGHRILSTGDYYYGLALYDLLEDGEFRLLDQQSINESRLDYLNRTGINVNMLEQEGSIMMGSFWPSPNGILSGNLYFRSGLFVPSKSELFFSIYDNNNPVASQRVVERRIIDNKNNDEGNGQWKNLNDQLDGGKYFIGMFNFAPKDRTFGLTKENQVMEFVWTQDGKVKFLPMGSIRELLNCYGNSSKLQEDAPTFSSRTSTTSTTPTMSTTIASTTTTKPEIIEKYIKSEKNNNEFNIENIEEDDEEEEEEKDEIPLPEDELNLNELDHQRDDPNNSHLQNQNELTSSSTAPRHLAEASARGPLFHRDDGLIWTFSILVAVVIILVVTILIPILIIKHKSRKNRICLNKQANGKNSTSKKQKNANGLDQTNCLESVQLMNSHQLEK